jgi:Cu/Ag efflux protein CusF
MSRHLLRTAMALGIAALALSFTGLVQAQGTSSNAPAPATTPPPKPKHHQYTGDVTAIDAKAGTVIVKKGASDSKTFKIGENTKYSTTDKPKGAALTDIKVGDKVMVRYSEEDGVLIAHSIGVPPSVKNKEATQ